MPTIDYADGFDNSAPIVLSDNSTQLQVLTGTATQSGVISESGGPHGLEKTGAGTLMLGAVNTYTGVTTISGGTLQLGDYNATGSLAGDVVDNAALTFANDSTNIFSGSISGSGSVTLLGVGSWAPTIFIGTNTYTGGTTIERGVASLQIGNGGTTGSITGDVVDHGLLTFDRSGTYAFTGNLSGTGDVDITGSGVMVFSGNSEVYGITIESGATLQIEAEASLTRSITNYGAIVFHIASGSTYFGATVGGDGSFEKTGGGTLVLTAFVSPDNGLIISDGTLEIDSGGGIRGSIVDNAALVIDDNTGALGQISGTGTLTVNSGGSVQLTENNSYSGITTIAGGDLSVGSFGGTGSLGSSAVIDDGRLYFTQNAPLIVGNVISGSGTVTEEGVFEQFSQTILTAANTYTGDTTIIGGTLTVDGSIAASHVDVLVGILNGSGTVGTTIVENDGTLSPGDTIGILHVNGDLTLQPLAHYAEDLSPGSADKAVVSGSASIAGTLIENFSGGTYTAGTQYTIVASTGVLSGGFTGIAITGLPAGLHASISYDAHDAYLTLLNNVTAKDFDANGKSDFLWQNSSGQPAEWLMNGATPVSQSIVGPNPGSDWKVIGAGDFNGDGEADILWRNTDGRTAIWMMNGLTPLTQTVIGDNPGTDWKMVASGDFNGDGKADILWQNTSGQAAIWLMDGTSVLSPANIGQNPGADWKVIGSGDFNADGKADILWQNASGQAELWLMDGTSMLSSSLIGQNPGTGWKVIGSGDFNGDGKADLLWQNADGQAGIWLMNGTSVSSQAAVGQNPGGDWKVMGSGDFNGDGKADILWQNTSGQAAVWQMSGLTVTSQSLAGSNPGSSWHIAMGTGS